MGGKFEYTQPYEHAMVEIRTFASTAYATMDRKDLKTMVEGTDMPDDMRRIATKVSLCNTYASMPSTEVDV